MSAAQTACVTPHLVSLFRFCTIGLKNLIRETIDDFNYIINELFKCYRWSLAPVAFQMHSQSLADLQLAYLQFPFILFFRGGGSFFKGGGGVGWLVVFFFFFFSVFFFISRHFFSLL